MNDDERQIIWCACHSCFDIIGWPISRVYTGNRLSLHARLINALRTVFDTLPAHDTAANPTVLEKRYIWQNILPGP